MISAVVAVDDAPAVLLASGGTPENPTRVVVLNPTGEDPVALGGQGVTFAVGFPLAAAGQMEFTLVGGDDLWAICDAAGAANLRVLKSQS